VPSFTGGMLLGHDPAARGLQEFLSTLCHELSKPKLSDSPQHL
jgi:hypothetical protein